MKYQRSKKKQKGERIVRNNREKRGNEKEETNLTQYGERFGHETGRRGSV